MYISNVGNVIYISCEIVDGKVHINDKLLFGGVMYNVSIKNSILDKRIKVVLSFEPRDGSIELVKDDCLFSDDEYPNDNGLSFYSFIIPEKCMFDNGRRVFCSFEICKSTKYT